MAARLITDADVRKHVGCGALVVDHDTRITPSALDRAHHDGIAIEWRAAPGKGLVVARDVERLPRAARLAVSAGTIVTQRAMDRAVARAIEITVGTIEPRKEIAPPPQAPLTTPASAATSTCPSCSAEPAAPAPAPPRMSSSPRADRLRELFAPAGEDAGC